MKYKKLLYLKKREIARQASKEEDFKNMLVTIERIRKSLAINNENLDRLVNFISKGQVAGKFSPEERHDFVDDMQQLLYLKFLIERLHNLFLANTDYL